MSQKLTLARYLQGRGEVKALTHIEAQAFGVPYPLQPGWPRRYGAIEITDGMIEDLKGRIATAKESTASKARRGLEGVGLETPAPRLPQPKQPRRAGPPASQVATAVPAVPSMFHGFALRQAKRYRSRRSAPWA